MKKFILLLAIGLFSIVSAQAEEQARVIYLGNEGFSSAVVNTRSYLTRSSTMSMANIRRYQKKFMKPSFQIPHPITISILLLLAMLMVITLVLTPWQTI